MRFLFFIVRGRSCWIKAAASMYPGFFLPDPSLYSGHINRLSVPYLGFYKSAHEITMAFTERDLMDYGN